MIEIEKLYTGELTIDDCNVECDFDNEEIAQLLSDGMIRPSDINQGRASDLIIDGVMDYDEYPFENFCVYEQLRQLENDAISPEEFMKLADFESFDAEEKKWFEEIMEKHNGN